MKFINIKDKIFQKQKGKIVFSDEVIIYEILNNEERIFQKIDTDTENVIKKLELYTKKLKRLYFEIFIDEFYFKNIEIEVIKDEVSEENLEKYIEYSVKEFLNESDLENYFIKYFKKSEEIYTVFIFERDFIEELIEFFLINKIKVEKIIIKNEEYILDNYDTLLKKNNTELTKLYVILGVMLFLFFGIVKIYNLKIEKEIEILNKNILLEEEKLNNLKLEHDTIEKEIIALKNKIEDTSEEKIYFNKKVLEILKMMPENIVLNNIYFEKNILTLKGISSDENSLFKFSKNLENSTDIEKVIYDYIVKKENSYEFFIEIKVL